MKDQARLVEPDFSVMPQLSPDDMAGIRTAGFASVINNRPDYEGGVSQPTSAELAEAAQAVGLTYRHLPVPPNGHTEQDARRMAMLVRSLPKPVLAFCRTGNRAAALFEKGKLLA